MCILYPPQSAVLEVIRVHSLQVEPSCSFKVSSPPGNTNLQCVAIIRAVVRFEKLLKRTIFVGISHGIPNGSIRQ